jgi:hypothetical protein
MYCVVSTVAYASKYLSEQNFLSKRPVQMYETHVQCPERFRALFMFFIIIKYKPLNAPKFIKYA